MVKCMCINDKGRPETVPSSKWIKEGELYTVIYTTKVLPQNLLAFQLEEVELDESCFPYEYFLANRFAFTEDGIMELADLIEDSEQIDMSISDLMKQTNIATK
jgi:hypothetical protein